MITTRYKTAWFVYVTNEEIRQISQYLPWSTYVLTKLNPAVTGQELTEGYVWFIERFNYLDAVLHECFTTISSSAERQTIADTLNDDEMAAYVCRAGSGTMDIVIGIADETFARMRAVITTSALNRLWETLDRRMATRLGPDTLTPITGARETMEQFVSAVFGFTVPPRGSVEQNQLFLSMVQQSYWTKLFRTTVDLTAIRTAVVGWVDRYVQHRIGIKPEWLAKYLGVKDTYVINRNAVGQ